MQREATTITGFTAVMAALGFLFRWLQGLRIYDPETGLADGRAGINFWFIGIVIITMAVLLGFVLYLRRFGAPEGPGALDGRTLLHPLVGMFAGAVLAVAGAVMIVRGGSYDSPTLRRLLGLLMVLGGAGAVELTLHAGKNGKELLRRISAVLITVMGCVWLVAEYKENAANPVIWSFAMEILALCAATLAFYFVAGYQFGEKQTLRAVFFCFAGMFLCVICIIDEQSLADSIAFAAAALLLGLWGFVLTENLHKPDKSIGIRQ